MLVLTGATSDPGRFDGNQPIMLVRVESKPGGNETEFISARLNNSAGSINLDLQNTRYDLRSIADLFQKVIFVVVRRGKLPKRP